MSTMSLIITAIDTRVSVACDSYSMAIERWKLASADHVWSVRGLLEAARSNGNRFSNRALPMQIRRRPYMAVYLEGE